MTEPVGLACPECGGPPIILLGGGEQAFCGNTECLVFIWNPTKTREELEAGREVIDPFNSKGK